MLESNQKGAHWSVKVNQHESSTPLPFYQQWNGNATGNFICKIPSKFIKKQEKFSVYLIISIKGNIIHELPLSIEKYLERNKEKIGKKNGLIFDQTLAWLYHVSFSSTTFLHVEYQRVEFFSHSLFFFFDHNIHFLSAAITPTAFETSLVVYLSSTADDGIGFLSIYFHLFSLTFFFSVEKSILPLVVSFVCCQVARQTRANIELTYSSKWLAKSCHAENEMQKIKKRKIERERQ